MVQSPKHETTQDPQLADLKSKWGRGWLIWRGRSYADGPDGVPSGDYIATRIRSDVGIDATLMCDTAADLNEALQAQLDAVRSGRKPPELAPLRP